MPSGELKGRRILIVEDEFVVSMEMEDALRAQGAEVIGRAPSVRAALAALEATDQLDAVVLDLNLRGELAYPVADVLRSRGIPFVFITAYSESEIRHEYAGVTYLGKPVTMLRIADTLSRVTKRGRVRRRLHH